MEFEYRVSMISGVPSSSEVSAAHAQVEDVLCFVLPSLNSISLVIAGYTCKVNGPVVKQLRKQSR